MEWSKVEQYYKSQLHHLKLRIRYVPDHGWKWEVVGLEHGVASTLKMAKHACEMKAREIL